MPHDAMKMIHNPSLTIQIGVKIRTNMRRTHHLLLVLVHWRMVLDTPKEEVKHDVLNSNDEGYFIIVKYEKLNMDVQQEFGIGDHNEDLNVEESVSSPIDIGLGVGVDVELDTEEKLKPKLRSRHEDVKSRLHDMMSR
ncbi:hypothetical protein PVK06_003590 [Gossypium arboreum]|uniref:Uncharacterized protein n=1 Tax=Gossypium arboreum TaxID=29729 RepID=A0ABR0R6R7_GOSAR|nr:hypothetical protein PVK06_003590 [Gossypium arboreum]